MKKSELIIKISESNAAYAAGIPFITDYEYDQLWQQLHSIDPTNDLLYHTAQQHTNLTGLTFHKYQIYGTNKAFNMEDLKPFLTRFGDQKLVIEPKYDGCAAVITQTKSGLTLTLEGNGQCGNDVTYLLPYITYDFNLRHFQAVELLIPWKDWDPSYGKNPRNVVAGWLARKHEKPPAMMTAIPHDFGSLRVEYNYEGNLESFSSFLLKTYSEWAEIYPIDGLMVKVADNRFRLVAGNNGQINNWSIAWKPPIQTEETIVTDIEWNVSRLGRVIPTVIYKPIELCGTTNSRVTGNNAKWIKEKEIIIDSKILVGKAGEIIPKILRVNNSFFHGSSERVEKNATTATKRPGVGRLEKIGRVGHEKTNDQPQGAKGPLPTFCPKCGNILKWEGVHLICNSDKCIAQLIVSITYFYSHKGIKIDGIGEALTEKLLQNENIFNILSSKLWALLDVASYNIYEDVYSILGNKIYSNIMKQIQEANEIKTMAHFIAGLGLPGLAYKTSLRLCQYVKSGKLNIPVSKNAMDSFIKGVMIFNKTKDEMKNFNFAQLPESAKAIYCITGTLSQSREAMITYLSELGYEFSNSVTRETNYLIVGQEPGKLKSRQATKYNIPQITEEQFFKLLKKEN